MRFAAYLTLFVLSFAAFSSANLQSELNDFYDLLPKIRLPFIIAKHYLFDGSFRTGYAYIKSNSFQRLLRQDFVQSPEVQQIANYLGLPLDLNYIQGSLRSLRIPLEFASDDYPVEARSFSSFVDEVVEYLPHDKFRQLIKSKIAKSWEFAELYTKVMSPEFKELVYQARYSKSLEKAVRTLANNEIYVDHLLQVTFELLNLWRV